MSAFALFLTKAQVLHDQAEHTSRRASSLDLGDPRADGAAASLLADMDRILERIARLREIQLSYDAEIIQIAAGPRWARGRARRDLDARIAREVADV